MADPVLRAKSSETRYSRRTLCATAACGIMAAGLVEMGFPERSLTAPLSSSVDMADMTWVEVRAAIRHGYSLAIVPTGGIEQNGPQMVLGKHDYVVRRNADRIARKLGRALVAPVLSYVPEGDYDPPSGNMLFPGTIGVSQQAFAAILEGIARSLKLTGFKTICFLGDHGGSQAAQSEVASRLTREWQREAVIVLQVADYYDVDSIQRKYLFGKGETQAGIGDHAGIIDTSELMAAHPQGVDLSRLRAVPWHSEPAGYSGEPDHASTDFGKALLEIKVERAVKQIRAVLQSTTSSQSTIIPSVR